MKGKVIVSVPQNYNTGSAHPEHNIITVSGKNAEFGSIMLRQEKLVLSPSSNIANIQARTAHFAGEIKNLVAVVSQFNLKEGDDFSKVMPVDLVVEESTDPFYEGQEPKINPQSGEVITHEGKEVYRYTRISLRSEERQDSLLKSDPAEVEVGATANTEFAKAQNQ